MSYYQLSDLYTKGGFALIILILCLLFAITIIVKKWISFKGIKENVINDFKEKIFNIIEIKAPKDAIYICYSYSIKKLFFKIKCPLSNVYIHILENISLNKEDLTSLINSKINYEIIKEEKGLGALLTLGIISPLIGIFGTLIGVIYSFEILASNGASVWPLVMGDIAESIISTAAGFLVAIIVFLFNNFFTKQIKFAKYILKDSSYELIRKLKSKDKVNDFEYLQEG